jgi:hypothetical protein
MPSRKMGTLAGWHLSWPPRRARVRSHHPLVASLHRYPDYSVPALSLGPGHDQPPEPSCRRRRQRVHLPGCPPPTSAPARRQAAPNVGKFTHECLVIRVARKLNAIEVIDVLSDLFILRGILILGPS